MNALADSGRNPFRRLTIYQREITLTLKLHTHCAQSITQKSHLTRIAMNHACQVVVPFWK